MFKHPILLILSLTKSFYLQSPTDSQHFNPYWKNPKQQMQMQSIKDESALTVISTTKLTSFRLIITNYCLDCFTLALDKTYLHKPNGKFTEQYSLHCLMLSSYILIKLTNLSFLLVVSCLVPVKFNFF